MNGRLERRERAAPGLHSAVRSAVLKCAPPGSRVIDMGTGQGALAQALSDDGFQVTAVDINRDDFVYSQSIEYFELDFDEPSLLADFVGPRRKMFDVVIGVEVVEHLRQPWSYVQALADLARKGALVVVTTPNTSSWHSRLTFLRRGEFDDFGSKGQIGHISPTTPWELEMMLTAAGVTDIGLRPVSDLYGKPSLRQHIITSFAKTLRPFQTGILDGLCIMATGKAPR